MWTDGGKKRLRTHPLPAGSSRVSSFFLYRDLCVLFCIFSGYSPWFHPILPPVPPGALHRSDLDIPHSSQLDKSERFSLLTDVPAEAGYWPHPWHRWSCRNADRGPAGPWRLYHSLHCIPRQQPAPTLGIDGGFPLWIWLYRHRLTSPSCSSRYGCETILSDMSLLTKQKSRPWPPDSFQ